jgi:hypothetical protein
MLEARADPKHPDHADVNEWLCSYSPDELDISAINVRLGRIAARRNAAAKCNSGPKVCGTKSGAPLAEG